MDLALLVFHFYPTVNIMYKDFFKLFRSSIQPSSHYLNFYWDLWLRYKFQLIKTQMLDYLKCSQLFFRMDLQAKEIHTVQFLWSLHPVDIVFLAFLTTIEVLIIRQA